MNGHRIDLPEMPVGAKFTGEYIDGGVKIVFETKSEVNTPDEILNLIIGRSYKCIKSVYMTADGREAYTSGRFYTCENKYSLTDNHGSSSHRVCSSNERAWFDEHFYFPNKP